MVRLTRLLSGTDVVGRLSIFDDGPRTEVYQITREDLEHIVAQAEAKDLVQRQKDEQLKQENKQLRGKIREFRAKNKRLIKKNE